MLPSAALAHEPPAAQLVTADRPVDGAHCPIIDHTDTALIEGHATMEEETAPADQIAQWDSPCNLEGALADVLDGEQTPHVGRHPHRSEGR